MTHPPTRFSRRHSRWTAAALLLAVLAAVTLLAGWAVARADRELRAELLQQAKLVAQPIQIKIKPVQAFSGTAADLALSSYQQLKMLLTATRAANPHCRFVYLLGRRPDGTVFFFVDSEPAGSKEYSPPGQVYEEVTAKTRHVFDSKTAIVIGPSRDRWGTWVSALVPLIDPKTGAVVAVLGLDIDASTWTWEVASRTALPVGLMLVLLIGTATLFAATRRTNAAPKPVMRRLLPPLTVMMFLLLGGAGFLLFRQHQQRLADEVANQVADAAGDWRVTLDQQTESLFAAAQPIAADARVQQALRTGDAASLLAAWRPVFETLRQKNHITHLNFITTDRVVLLRVHQPELRGDRIARFTLIKAEQTGKTASGLEPGRIGVFTLRVVQPVVSGGRCVGYVELGKEIDEVLQTLREHSDLELAVILRKERLNQPSWENNQRLHGREADWARLPHRVVTYASQGRLPDALAAWADPAAGVPAHHETNSSVSDGGKNWRVSAMPLTEASGQAVGELLFMRDISAEQAAFTQLMTVSGTAVTVLVALLLGFFYVLLRRTDAGIQAQQTVLRESEESYRNQFVHNSVVMLLIDPDTGAILDANDAAVRFYGYPRERLLTLAIADINTLPADEIRHIMVAISPEQGLCFQFQHRLANGSVREVAVSLSRIQFGGRVVMHSIIQDVTERKKAEEALRKSEARFRSYFDLPLHGIAITSPEKGWLEVNDRICSMLGYSRTEILHLTWSELTAPEDLAADVEQFDRLLSGQIEQYQIEKRFIRKDGTLFWTCLVVGCMRDADGRVNHVLALLDDIDARKRAEMERERLAAAIEQADEVIVITDVQGTIEYVNPAFTTVTGYSRAEAIGQNPRLLKSGKQDAAFYHDLWATLAGGKAWHGRFVNRKKNGTLYTAEATISPVLDAAGKITNYVTAMRDITEHLSLHAQLTQAQKMEAVGRLAGGVAHDFNNILQTILGDAELAIEQTPPTDAIRRDLEEIRIAAHRAADLTRQLLAFARKQVITPRTLDLNAAVEGVLKMLRRLIGENIELTWAPGAGLWPVNMDPSQIDQILANLCVNARDAIEGVGAVHIATLNTQVDELNAARHDEFSPGDYVLLTVSDTGGGMDAATRDQIFEPFFTTKATGKGTGLGLATVYGIVRQNRGHIGVYSEPGQGTTFRIHLPRHMDIQAAPLMDAPANTAPRGDETVLLVEDDLPLLNLSARMLRGLGYTVLAANAPEAARRLADEHPGKIHLLLTDIIMPGMNGRELAEQLTARLPQLKCLFMSGFTADVIARQGILDDDVHFIQKPFSAADLAAKIRNTLEATYVKDMKIMKKAGLKSRVWG